MFSKVLSLLTPDFKVSWLLNQLGVTAAQKVAIDQALARASSTPAVALFTGGQPLSLSSIVTILSQPESLASVTSALPALKSAVSNPETAGQVAVAIQHFMESDPNGEVLLGLMEKVSKLPIKGFGDTQHEGPSDFLQRAVFPLILSVPDGQEGYQIECRHCGVTTVFEKHPGPISTCPNCHGVQANNIKE